MLHPPVAADVGEQVFRRGLVFGEAGEVEDGLGPGYPLPVLLVRDVPLDEQGLLRAGEPGVPGCGQGADSAGWAARRGPVFMVCEPGPFPGSLPPNRTCPFPGIRLSGDLCRVRDGVRVDPVMARRADDERLAPHFRHEGGPRGLARSRFPELFEPGDLVDCHRGAGLA